MKLSAPTFPHSLKKYPAFEARSVGFDHLFDIIERFEEIPSYPPYNLVKVGEEQYRIDIAAAGFKKDEISVERVKDELVVKTNKNKNQQTETQVSYIHHGLAMRDFVIKFKLAQNVEIVEARHQDGILTIFLRTFIPEEERPKQIPIL